MSRRIAVVVLLVLVLCTGGTLLLSYLQKARLNANLVTSQNNLRQLSLFAAHHVNPGSTRDASKLPKQIPAATVVLTGVAPENRLSWVVGVLPGVDQKKNPTEELIARIDLTQPWSAKPNQEAGRTRLTLLLCPENLPQVSPNEPAITCYVGIAGLGLDAATLTLPDTGPVSPRAGAFRYDAVTPFERIADGLSQTLLMAETADNPGPWLRGGPSTTRGLDDAAGAKPLIGAGGQFGGYFPQVANYALCDGSVRTFTTRTTPEVLFKMATIAGGENETVPVE